MSTIHETWCLVCDGKGTITRKIGRAVRTRTCPTCNGSKRVTREQLADVIVCAAVHYRTFGTIDHQYDDAIIYVTKHQDWSLLHPWMRAVHLGPLPPAPLCEPVAFDPRPEGGF